jgi:hypothetical protein
MHVWSARRNVVEFLSGSAVTVFEIGSASHQLRTIDSKWSEGVAPASFGSRRLDE